MPLPPIGIGGPIAMQEPLVSNHESGALENFHSIPGWQSIDLAQLVAELVEERIANGNTEFFQAIKAWDGNNEDYAFSVAIDALMFWLEGNSGNFDDIRGVDGWV
jgi:hypothetical protein